MTTPAFEQRAIPVAQHLVYTRRRAAGALPTDGKLDGWALDENLRCERITMTEGPHPATADFTFVPQGNSQYRVEFALNRYQNDDQVKVVMLKLDSELIEAPGDKDQGLILFEGFIARRSWGIQTSDQGSDEGVGFVAVAFPFLDDVHPDNLITGRWMFDREDETVAADNKPFVVLSPTLPAVFNHQGRPNMSRQRIAGGLIAESITAAPVFTHDDDPAGQFWTVRSAIASIALQWIFGPQLRIDDGAGQHTILNYKTLARHICLDLQLTAELGREPEVAGLQPQHADLGKRLPEVSVHGLGPLTSIQTICNAAGFKMALEPVQDSELSSENGYDRRYRLRVWQANHGRQRTVDLSPAGSQPILAEYLYRDNNIHGVQAVEDSKEIVNEVIAVGESLIEGRIVLRPAWRPDEVDNAALTAQLRSNHDALLAGTGYHAKHVQGGALFEQYGHVGRIWVADCVGDPFGNAGTDIEGYASGIYKHEDQGFDFPEALGLSVTGNAVEQERASAGLPASIRWSNRLRRALPLRSAEAQAVGRDFYLEVSEDGGSSWKRIDKAIYRTLRDGFGILLTGAANLAMMNHASLANNRICKLDESWWALIKNELLLFRITCAVKTDHAVIALAARQSTSGSIYKRAQLVIARGAEEVWQAPGTLVNDTTEHRKALGWGGKNAVATPGLGSTIKSQTRTLSDIAELRRNGLEARRGSYQFSAFIWTYNQHKLGDAITKIKGREIPLSTNSGEATSYPTVVAIEVILSPGKSQGVLLTCEDHILRGQGGRR